MCQLPDGCFQFQERFWYLYNEALFFDMCIYISWSVFVSMCRLALELFTRWPDQIAYILSLSMKQYTELQLPTNICNK